MRDDWNEGGLNVRIRRGFLFLAFALVVLFVTLLVQRLVAERSPEARLKALLPKVGAQVVGVPFDPALHDRELEAIPWGAGEKVLRIADHTKGVLFLNFWATYCEPCVRELPSMLRLARLFERRSFTMLAVTYDPSWDEVGTFFQSVMGGVPRDLVLARDPETEKDMLRERYGTDKIPETYVIKDGVILHRFVNARDWMDPMVLEYFDLLFQVDG